MEVTKLGIVAGSSISITRLEDFPADVIFNILSRLPVKSLMCCRCVCKIWHNIIDSPSFTNMHFTSRRADIAEEPQLMLIYYAIHRHDKMRLISLMDNGTKVLRSSEFPVAEIANFYRYLVSSLCYGLFCCRNYRDMGKVFLLNPLRGEVLMLPPASAKLRRNPYSLGSIDFYGVGFDCTTETFKVVHIYSHKSDSDLKKNELATEVYTLGTRSWRDIAIVPPCYAHGMAVSAYGDVHWEVVRWLPDGSKETMIMSFDTRKEEFKLTPHPNLPTKLFGSFHLLYFRGHLAMVDTSSTTHIEVWVSKDYDTKEWAIEYRISVEKLVDIRDLNTGFRRIALRTVIGVGAWEHGLLFYGEPNRLYYYNLKTDI